MNSLSLFHPLVEKWFREQVGTPTDVQSAAWEKIASGKHVLVTAPTGSGKTLTAFLWALNQLASGDIQTGRCSILYISPLKALNNDIQRNLLTPLSQLKRVFEENGEEFPNIRVMTRSGDTPNDERRRMQRKPPEILITTPESLNLLLSSQGGMGMLDKIQCVILDEIHAVIDSKRGSHLISAVERLVPLSGEFQRISLSATVRPLELVAEFVGGYKLLDGERYEPREVEIVRSDARKTYDVRVHFPEAMIDETGSMSTWPPIINACKETLQQNRSTLIFTNGRRLAETITWKINAGEDELLAYAHHGSLSKDVRREVEEKLKAGRLKAIVATNSLEMGIDIGSLDEVVLIQSPFSISSAIQRIGRAGHRVGEVSRGTFLPTHPHDLLNSAVLAKNILSQNIEDVHAIRCPLDVLSQVLISMTGMETWDIDELFAEIRRSFTFHNLTREQFDLVLNMLAGRYSDTRIRGLRARVSIDRLDNNVAARPGALQDLYLAGGTIPDRGYYHLRHLETGAVIGELDEEYIWEAALGQMMTFGTQSWRIERITHNDVFVSSVKEKSARQAPFWKAEEINRDFHLSEEIGLFLEYANDRLDDPEFITYLCKEHCLPEDSAMILASYLKRQKDSCRTDLPHRHHIVIEHVTAGLEGCPSNQIIIHTGWGGRVNRPFSMALGAAWDEQFGTDIEIFPSDDAIYIQMPDDVSGDELLSLVTSARLESLLRAKLETTGFFGARFRENAGRAMLITRRRARERMPLWVNRLQSKKILDSIYKYADFPILLETWRCCLQDEFDLDTLRRLLSELETGAITWSEAQHDYPSPFAQTMSWRQINQYMYADDTPKGKANTSNLRTDLLQEVVFTPGLRPAIAAYIIERFVDKRQRIASGYSPQSPRDLLDWVKERLLIPLHEWKQLLQAIEDDHGIGEEEMLRANSGKLAQVMPPLSRTPLIAAVEDLPRLRGLWNGDLSMTSLHGELMQAPDTDADEDEESAGILGEWLSYYGPLSIDSIGETLGIGDERLMLEVEDLIDTQRIIQGRLVQDGAEFDICDSENFEILLRMSRADATPSFEPLPGEKLPLFIAHFQGLCKPGDDIDDLWNCMEQLSGCEARAELWEESILPARIRNYDTSRLDSLMQEGQLHWYGMGKEKVCFCLEEDLPVVRERGESEADDLRDLVPEEHVRYSLQALTMKHKSNMEELVGKLWSGLWDGVVTNDSVAALRKGIMNNFKPPTMSDSKGNSARSGRRTASKPGFSRWSGSVPFAGNWYRLPDIVSPDDFMENEERIKDRVRMLLDRYGILFRELLKSEAPQFQWANIFRALRLMELSGEVLSGCFFHGIPGLQFISHRAFHLLRRALPENAVWWVNACDPASFCGVPLDTFKGSLPKRLPGNYVAYKGSEPVLIVQRNAKDLLFRIEPDDQRFQECLAPLHNLLDRRFNPERHLTVETINGEEACTSPYLDPLGISFEVVRDYKRVFVSRKFF
ncbi:MAG: DEAD/DEAH box helicase [Armatimonadota bacterium]